LAYSGAGLRPQRGTPGERDLPNATVAQDDRAVPGAATGSKTPIGWTISVFREVPTGAALDSDWLSLVVSTEVPIDHVWVEVSDDPIDCGPVIHGGHNQHRGGDPARRSRRPTASPLCWPSGFRSRCSTVLECRKSTHTHTTPAFPSSTASVDRRQQPGFDRNRRGRSGACRRERNRRTSHNRPADDPVEALDGKRAHLNRLETHPLALVLPEGTDQLARISGLQISYNRHDPHICTARRNMGFPSFRETAKIHHFPDSSFGVYLPKVANMNARVHTRSQPTPPETPGLVM
jgi:hypothetical protein